MANCVCVFYGCLWVWIKAKAESYLPAPHPHAHLQIGVTDSDTYVHRLGRCGRAGKSGSGLLILGGQREASYMLATIRDEGRAPIVAAGPESSITGGVSSLLGPGTPVVSKELQAVMALVKRDPDGELAQVGLKKRVWFSCICCPRCPPLPLRWPPGKSESIHSVAGLLQGARCDIWT